MLELPIGIAVLASLVPYVIHKKRIPHGKQLTIQAVNWSLHLVWHRGKCDWTFRLPLAERARSLFQSGPTKVPDEHHPELPPPPMQEKEQTNEEEQ